MLDRPARPHQAARERRRSTSGPIVRRLPAFVLFAGLAASAVAPPAARAANTDLVILQNGDRISGEVKGLSRGKLDYSTDDAGRLSIEWDKVARLTSIHLFEVELYHGATYFGRIVESNRGRFLVVEDGGTSDTLRIEDVVEMAAIDAGFLQRVKAYLDMGFTLAKAHQATTYSLAGQADYRGDKLGSELKFDSYLQGQ